MKLGLAIFSVALFTVPLTSGSGVLPGAGNIDGWVDVNGDTMTGPLTMQGANIAINGNALQFNGASLTGNPDLKYGSNAVCLAGAVITGCGGSATGDITGVAAGTGLTGGGTSGDVSLAVDTSTIQKRVTGTCSTGAMSAIASDGSVTCSSASGDITGVAAGTGLTGGGTTGDVTIGVAPGGITATELASNSVTSAKIQDGQVSTADLAFDPATQAELDAHKTSGDHDARYSLRSHPEDLATSFFSIPITVGFAPSTTILSVTVTVPDECPGAENHQYLVEASSLLSAASLDIQARLSLTVDSTTFSTDESFRYAHLTGAIGNNDDSIHTMKLFGTVQPGTHTFRLLGDNPGANSYIVSRSMLTVTHFGWTGC